VARALVDAALHDPGAVLERLVGDLTEFHVEHPPQPPYKSNAPEAAPQRLPPLPPLAAALSAEAHLLATLLSDERPPELLGMGRVMKLMALAAEHGGAERAAAA
jgi:hypothetical protein